jgi:hypothetical protein
VDKEVSPWRDATQVDKETGVSEQEPLYVSPGEAGKRGFENLECYKLALEVMAKIHDFSERLPPDERFDLYAQMCTCIPVYLKELYICQN